ncbi:hypothetical protein [Streptomyces sp. ISID311]|uniref:hypothetical protein n=1 Tax=Streptomyces sp. ISID311 TaxID=2601673 RepID=UPI00164BB803|nr:hypothetical protein [Streptomyces sp. ISID311]
MSLMSTFLLRQANMCTRITTSPAKTRGRQWIDVVFDGRLSIQAGNLLALDERLTLPHAKN